MAAKSIGGIRLTDLVFFVAIAGSLAVVFAIRSGNSTPTPETAAAVHALFDGSPTYAQAVSTAKTEGKPIMVLATADWCPPCQQLKKQTLSDPQVQARLNDVAVPYKLDVTNTATMSTEDNALAQQLGVQGIPALYIIQDGQIKAQRTGFAPKASFLSWLESGVKGE